MATKKNTAREAKPIGRPSLFTAELAGIICARIADGESVRKICASEDMPAMSSVFKWLTESKEFSEQYAHAREAQADKYAEEIIEIADDGTNDTYVDENGNERTNQEVVARSRLRVDARKWYASKLAPKKYGDKIQQEVSGSDGGPLVVEITRFGSK